MIILLFLLFNPFYFFQRCPVEKSSTTVGGASSGICISGDYLYLGVNGFSIYDIRVPALPQLISKIDWEGYTEYIYVKDDYAYCAVMYYGLKIIDISNKMYPKVIGYYQQSSALGLAIYQDILYLFLGIHGIHIIDISNKKNPKFISKISDINAFKGIIIENLLYLAGRNFYIISLSNPKEPQIISSVKKLGAEDIRIKGNYAFLPAGSYYLAIVDISDVKNPKLVNLIGKPSNDNWIRWTHIEIMEDVVILGSDLATPIIFSIYDLNNIFLTGYLSDGPSMALLKKGKYLYCSHTDHNLRIYDMSYCQSDYLYPDASFTYTPANPKAGERVYFEDTSYPLAQNLQWDFGDGQKSTAKYPTNVYLKAGEYEVKLIASNLAGSSEYSKKIIVSEGNPAPPFEESGEYKYLIPAVAHSAGANGTFWQSDLNIVNPDWSNEADVDLYFIEEQAGNCNYEGFNLKIEKYSEVRLEDIVYKMFGGERRGAMWVTSNIPIVPTSRTYNKGGAGTYGQNIPAIEKEKLQVGERGSILSNITWNDEYRTNIGFVNTTNEDRYTSFNEIENWVYLTVWVKKCSWRQLSLNELLDLEHGIGYTERFLHVLGYHSGVFIYSSVIDNRTGDAIFIPRYVLP